MGALFCGHAETETKSLFFAEIVDKNVLLTFVAQPKRIFLDIALIALDYKCMHIQKMRLYLTAALFFGHSAIIRGKCELSAACVVRREWWELLVLQAVRIFQAIVQIVHEQAKTLFIGKEGDLSTPLVT